MCLYADENDMVNRVSWWCRRLRGKVLEQGSWIGDKENSSAQVMAMAFDRAKDRSSVATAGEADVRGQGYGRYSNGSLRKVSSDYFYFLTEKGSWIVSRDWGEGGVGWLRRGGKKSLFRKEQETELTRKGWRLVGQQPVRLVILRCDICLYKHEFVPDTSKLPGWGHAKNWNWIQLKLGFFQELQCWKRWTTELME